MLDPYGKVTVLDGNGTPRAGNLSAYGNPWTFTGRRLDQETGLMYYRNRMYEVGLGRFCGRDPIGYVDGMGLYRAYFVPGASDPLGLWTEIRRNTQDPWAYVCSNGGEDSWPSLAVLVNLNSAEYQKWVSNLDGSNVGPTPQVGKTYRLPNTFLFLWMGVAGPDGRWWTGYNKTKAVKEAEGFHIEEINAETYLKNKVTTTYMPIIPSGGPYLNLSPRHESVPVDIDGVGFLDDTVKKISDLSGEKKLFGWYHVSHGSPSYIWYENGKFTAGIDWDRIAAANGYGLGWAEAWACDSGYEGKAALNRDNPNGHWHGIIGYHDPIFGSQWAADVWVGLGASPRGRVKGK